jgi:osmotically inducible protein OsmC
MKPNASAIWFGGLKSEKCVVTTESGTLSESQYSERPGDGKGKGTNPYELIAAAHAGCFSMALANELAVAGFIPIRINTTANVAMEQLEEGWIITGIKLDVVAEAPLEKQSVFIEAAVRAKTNCMVSRILKTNIFMSAKLENSQKRRTREKPIV